MESVNDPSVSMDAKLASLYTSIYFSNYKDIAKRLLLSLCYEEVTNQTIDSDPKLASKIEQ